MKKYKITNHFLDELYRHEEKAIEYNELSRDGWEFVAVLTSENKYGTTLWSKDVTK